MSGNLRGRVAGGVAWAGFGQIGSQAIHYGAVLVLAWTLSPLAFGLVGLALVVISVTQAVGELGIAAALVQQPEHPNERELSTAFWANLAVNVFLAALLASAAGPLSRWLDNRDAEPVLRALAVALPVTAIGVVPRALLERSMSFSLVTRRDFLSEICFGVFGIGGALLGAGVWSLVAAILAQRLFGGIALWVAVDFRPRFFIDREVLRRLAGFGLPVMLAMLTARAIANADYFVVGKWLGVEQLGYYTLAFQLSVTPAQRIIGVGQRVAFPAFASIQHDQARLRKGFLDGQSVLFGALAVLAVAFVALSPSVIAIAYGPKWLPSVAVLQVLGAGVIFYGFDVAQALFFAVGRPAERLRIMLVRVAAFGILVAAIGLQHGIIGVAASLVASVALSSVMSVHTIRKILRVGWSEVLAPLRTATAFLLVGGAATVAVSLGLSESPLHLRNAVIISALLITAALVQVFPTLRPLLRTALHDRSARGAAAP